MPSIVREGIAINYEVQGRAREHEPPLLLLPGTLSSSQVWMPVVRALGDVQVVLLDHRDCGRSGDATAPYTAAQLADDALAVLDDAGFARAHLAGHSMGGVVAQELALRAPGRVATLSLVSSWARVDAYLGSYIRLWRTLRDRLPDDEFMRANLFLTHGAHALKTTRLESLARGLLAFGPLQSVGGFQRNLDAVLEVDTRARLGALAIPTDVVWGGDDKLIPPWHAAELVAAIPNARPVRLEGVGHMPMWEAPERLAAALLERIRAI